MTACGRKLPVRLTNNPILERPLLVNADAQILNFKKSLPDLIAHQISTVTGILATGAVVWGLSRNWSLESAGQAWFIGVF